MLQDLQLTSYRSQDDSLHQSSEMANGNGHSYKHTPAAFSVNLKGCEVTPDVNISHGKYGIRLAIPSQDGMSDLWLKCETEGQYSRWMAACRLAAKGKTLADRGYDAEVKSIQAFLSMQHPANQPVINPATLDINVDEYLSNPYHREVDNQAVSFQDLIAHFGAETEVVFDEAHADDEAMDYSDAESTDA